MENDKNIDKIIVLLNNYIQEYNEIEKYNDILLTRVQLFNELMPLVEKNYELLENNKLFISVLLNALYNDEVHSNNFYNAMIALKNGNEKLFYQFISDLNFDYKEEKNKFNNNKLQLSNRRSMVKSAKKSIFYLTNRRPLFDYSYIFKNIRRIINYYATKGLISNKEEILLCNELDCYNRMLMKGVSKEKEYSIKKHDEIPNILCGGFEMYDDIDISASRKQSLDKFVNEIKLYEKDIPTDELVDIISTYKIQTDFDNEYNYVVNELVKYYLFQALDYYEFLLSEGTYSDKNLRNENVELYYKTLEKYLILRKYYDEINDLQNIESVDEEVDDDLDEEDKEKNKIIIFAHPSSSPTKSRLILDLKDMPFEYYQATLDLIDGFINNTVKPKSLVNNKKSLKAKELKDDQVRIIFRHVKQNIYCITGVFAKKANNDVKMYRTMFNRSIADVSTDDKLFQEIALGEVTLNELRSLVTDKARKGSR